jgi:hypothetical protein
MAPPSRRTQITGPNAVTPWLVRDYPARALLHFLDSRISLRAADSGNPVHVILTPWARGCIIRFG